PCPVIISLFFVLRPLLPPSTLFPYTTLFRSPLLSTISSDRATYLPTLSPFPNGDMLNSRSTIAHVPFFEGTGYFSSLRPKKSCQDRKSTRLNSSHGSNSYAVFCLKKKHDERS